MIFYNIKDFFIKIFYKIKALSKSRILITLSLVTMLLICNITYFLTFSDQVIDFSGDPEFIDSGIYGDTICINRLNDDYYYYLGLNYTDNDGTIPTNLNKNIYNDSNLVQVKSIYSGDDLLGNIGYVSLTERQNRYIYFNTYSVNNNGTPNNYNDDYIIIELLDAPFTDRPNGLAFNGWKTDYQGAFISYDSDYYLRYAKIPVNYIDGKPQKIDITFHTIWTVAKVSNLTSSGWNTAFNNLLTQQMISITQERYNIPVVTGYFTSNTITTTLTVTRRGNRYTTTRSNGTCTNCYDSEGTYHNNYTCPDPINYNANSAGTYTNSCQMYYIQDSNDDFSENETYYELNNGQFSTIPLSITLDGRELVSPFNSFMDNSTSAAGFYKKIMLNRNENMGGYYRDNGDYIESGVCNQVNGCYVYDLLQYYDNNEEQLVGDNDLYYLVTRDTNIIVQRANISNGWSNANTKPFTFTGVDNHVDYSTNYLWTISTGWFSGNNVTCYNDTNINNIRVESNQAKTTTTQNSGSTNQGLYANWFNLKVGRKVRSNGNNTTFAFVAGSRRDFANLNTLTKYNIIVESGIYNSMSLSTDNNGSNRTVNIMARGTYGSDYDYANNNNNLLEVRYCASGSWSGVLNGENNRSKMLDLIVKSGSFGTNKYDYTTGIYIGGLSNGTHNAARAITIYGGYIYNLLGGPLTADNRSSLNDTYAYIRGGEIDVVIGGAGRSQTYGNRIIQITGGTVNYSVFGGSNGIQGDDNQNRGTINGSTYIYAGGNAVIGNTNYVNNNQIEQESQVEAGSIFGAGNGRENYSEIGSTDNTTIIIDEQVTVRRNIYGGGNHGAVGYSSNLSTLVSTIDVHGGHVLGSIYGGGNQNGSGIVDGNKNVTTNINITMDNGTIDGSIYGGSNLLGKIYGGVNINVTGGTVGNIYGGGKGGYENAANYGTFVRDNINVIVGNNTPNKPTINGSVYGGSAYGSVNALQSSNNVSTANTNVTINNGTIDSVFGGGQGSNQYTPYVMGNVTVNINGGNINNVFGANNQSGSPNGTITVNVNGGNVTNTFGGGNQTGANITNVNLSGGTSTKVYGGSNQSGDVNETNVHVTGGASQTVYGANNQGGVTNKTNVVIDGGNINSVYGGGERTSVNTQTSVIVNNSVNNIFGGSNLIGNIPVSYITVNDGHIDNLYGGNNQGGKTSVTNVTINNGDISNTFGGGFNAESDTTNVTINGGLSANLYGGGNESGAQTTNVKIGDGFIGNIFGGSNLEGNVNQSFISNTNASSIRNVNISETITTSSLHDPNNSNYLSSQRVSINVTNPNANTINNWDLYILTEDSFLAENNSGYNLINNGNIFHFNEVGNKYISANSSININFDIHSRVSSNDFRIIGYTFVGRDANGNIYKSKSLVDNIYGGNNQGGKTTTTNIDLTRSYINNIYGGGNMAITDTSNVDLNNVTIYNNVFGGGNEASTLTSNLTISNSNIGTASKNGNVFGGGNRASSLTAINLTVDDNTTIYGNVYGGANLGLTDGVINTNIDNSNINGDIFGGGNEADVNNNITLNIGNNSHINGNIYSGGNLGDTIGYVESNISDTVVDANIYGGGNRAFIGTNINANANLLNLNNVTATNVYGGGNASYINGNVITEIRNCVISDSIYGGGNGLDSAVIGDETGEQNNAKVLGNTNLIIENTTVNNIYGGGNLGMVNGSTQVYSTNNTVSESEYGGGNAAIVQGNTYINVNGGTVLNSIYGGGNGILAKVRGNTTADVHNGVNVTNHVFAGCNAAESGMNNNTDFSTVNIVGATIGKNVYGGPNTSTVNGAARVNIGKNAVNNSSLIPSDIVIGGTVFGGGENNASGSPEFKYDFISVTKGINVLIDGSDHNNFRINGSIFGSGNASSSAGARIVTIKNYGTETDIRRNISIQRASELTIDNSFISLSGAKDRNNDFEEVLFSFSNIDELKMINSSSLYLEKGATLLKKVSSLAYENGNIVKGYATIDNENHTITRNVNNRIYMLEGENLNIATDGFVTKFGEVSGMFFFGMFEKDRNDNIITALYSNYDYLEEVPGGELYFFSQGSYALGSHLTNHNISVDGFYSNYASEDGRHIVNKYIEPTPTSAQFYIWSIGEVVASYDLTLTASKYSTLGVKEIALINHASPNTVFSILGVNFSSLNEDIDFVDYNDIPRVASSEEIANSIFGLSMKSGSTGWLVDGSTKFITEGTNNVVGTTMYERENVNNTPSLAFYLYHSKNVSYVGSLGSVTISLAAITTVDGLNKNVERININIDLYSALYDTNDYEGTIAPGKKYEMFGNSQVKITSNSSFSTYYSLYINTENSPYNVGYHRALVSTYAYPINTKITMIDLHDKTNPVYYYYVIDETDYNNSVLEYNANGESSYNLSKFIKMGSTSSNNNYDDGANNLIYYNNGVAEEEFIFIVDFKDANITSNVYDKSMLIELRNQDDYTLVSVLGLEQSVLKYSLYKDSDAFIEVSGTVSKNPIYLGDSAVLTVDTDYVLSQTPSFSISDTTLEEEKLGIKISIYDSHDNLLTAQDLFGISFTFNDNIYYPRYDGTTRIKIADKIGSARSWIIFNTGTSRLSTGRYTIKIESFGSYDGTYYGKNEPHETEIELDIISTLYGLQVNVRDEMLFINKDTGKTGLNNNVFAVNMKFISELNDPSVKVKLQRRKYDNVYDTEYYDVDFKDYFDVNYSSSGRAYEYDFVENPGADMDIYLNTKSNLMSGTYRMVFNLYDGNNYIGNVYKYIIIK